jgi:hypothetical protein
MSSHFFCAAVEGFSQISWHAMDLWRAICCGRFVADPEVTPGIDLILPTLASAAPRLR